jgi:Xaa-Pro aminopeptidase
MTTDHPRLSTAERDRRFAATRAFLRGAGLDALLLYGLRSRERYESWLAKFAVDGVVVFPLDGEPSLLTWGPHRITAMQEAAARGEEIWIDDMRQLGVGPGVVEVLLEKGLGRARIGVFGHRTRGPAEVEGIIPHPHWDAVVRGCPPAAFEEVTDAFTRVMLVKSAEEQALIRRSAAIGEAACARLLETVREGTTDHAIAAAYMHAIYAAGAVTNDPHLILSLGAGEVGWAPLFWGAYGGPPRVIRRGDLVQAELFPRYAGVETQQQLAVSVGPPSPAVRLLADAARAAYEAGLSALRPGVPFKAVNDAMWREVEKRQAWHLTPLVHGLAPLSWTGQVGTGIAQLGLDPRMRAAGRPLQDDGFIVESGMAFELEPNACHGRLRVNIGGTVLVTDSGAEELNSLPTRLLDVS